MTLRPGIWLSLALHGVLVLALITLTVESSPRALFVDLVHGWLPGSPDAAQGSPARAGAAPPRRVAAVRPTRPPGGARVPSPSAAPAAPSAAAAPVTAPAAPAETPAAATRVDIAIVEAPSATAAGRGVPGGSLSGSGGGEATGMAGAAPGGAGGARLGAGGIESGRGVAAALRPGDGPGGGGPEYEGYYRLIRRRIQEALEYPMSARRRGVTGTVVIEIDVDADGAIGRVTLASSSSHRLLDDAVLEAARGLGRTPFPPGLRPRPLRMQLPIVFDLR